MSMTDAFALVCPHLPHAIAEKAIAKLSAIGSAEEVTFDGFSLWKVKDAANLAFITERRARACPEQGLRLGLEQQHKLLAEALHNGTQDRLWQAYFTTGGKHTSFILNLATGVVRLS